MARRVTKPVTADVSDLPPGVTEADLTHDYTQALPYGSLEEIGGLGFTPYLTFYRTKDIGWVLCTLHISNPSRRQAAGTSARSYGIGVADGKVYTVGRGPHVTREVTVYLTKANLDRLRRYADLWRKGMEDAQSIRDRISSRRAQGQLYRAAGRTHWNW